MIQLSKIPEPFKSKLEATLGNKDYCIMESSYIFRYEDISTDFGKWLISKGEEEFAGEIEYKLTI